MATIVATSCAHLQKEVTIERRDTLEQAVAELRRCLPPAAEQVKNKHQLAIAAIRILPKKTAVDLVAWAGSKPAALTLPLYVQSRGRWLIEENDRVYLVDQNCRTYPLLDVEFKQPRSAPGVIQILPYHAIEGSLFFPPPSTSFRLGALVFGHRSLPLVLDRPTLPGGASIER